MVVYYSDDGGETYQLSNSTFPRADEASLTALNDSHLVANQRLSVDVIIIVMHWLMLTKLPRSVRCASRAVTAEGKPSRLTPA